MRLLHIKGDGDLILTEDLVRDEDIPPYAILSHTWEEGQEVTFDDFKIVNTKEKAGWRKIDFCSRQARQSGLHYIWVDTCCIDKSNNTELSEAINSMFRWYQEAKVCYVYLFDIPSGVPEGNSLTSLRRKPAIRQSRWFTRGWTLQELLAPVNVEFFSNEGTRLGDKITLEQEIHQVTKIPLAALRRQARLSEFSIEERMSWAAQRTTSKKEDKAYCLLGILGVFLPLIYGEGEYHALQRLREEAEKRQGNQSMVSSPREITGMNIVRK
ncbi:hypothetical protein N0V90_003964 [Kalmusia sp. IMI 367209]|nr:hypothetical protein N0V90_003964 [Kalmusia sp. IMI 367209]